MVEKIRRWGDVTMHLTRRIVMKALFVLPLLVHLGWIIRIATADGVPTVWPT